MSKIILKAGDLAPDFTLAADDGASVTLSGLSQKVVLYFYPKDDTSGCTTEALDFHRLGAEFAEAKTAIFGVSPDPVRSHARFKAKHGFAVPLLADEDKSVLTAYGVWTEKSMYGRTYMGVERTTLLLDADRRIRQIWNKVKVPGHAEAVLAAARSI